MTWKWGWKTALTREAGYDQQQVSIYMIHVCTTVVCCRGASHCLPTYLLISSRMPHCLPSSYRLQQERPMAGIRIRFYTRPDGPSIVGFARLPRLSSPVPVSSELILAFYQAQSEAKTAPRLRLHSPLSPAESARASRCRRPITSPRALAH